MAGRERILRFAIGISLLSVFPVAYLIRPFVDTTGITICIFRLVTGKPCPFCGLTRAFSFAMHGEFFQAAQFHPLWWLAALVIFTVAIIAITDAVFNKMHLNIVFRFWDQWAWGLIFLLIISTLFRLI